MKSVVRFVEGKLKLKVNQEKERRRSTLETKVFWL
jgi:hypothetical protein